jgi:hypothetical protein
MARFEIDFLTEYTDEALLDEIRRVSVVLGGRPLTQVAFNVTSGKVHPQTVIRRFGGWKKALAKAGLDDRFVVRNYTDQECFENLAEVWTHYGRPPAYREMFQPPSKIQGKTYVYRWGTWRKALKTFVDWANAEDQLQELISEPQASGSSQPPVEPNLSEADRRQVRPGLRFKVFMRDRFRCLACGRSPATHLNIELHADHIQAVANGGKTVIENLQTLCKDCNLGKGRTIIA